MGNRPKLKFKAFVLMPFDPEFDAIFDKLIKPPLEEVGYDVKRADNFLDQHNILKDIVRGIARADLVVADLTSLNANVLYELGLSHAMLKTTVLLAQSIEEVPFDLSGYRVVSYSIHFNEAGHLSRKLKEIGQKAKTGKLGYGNPMTDFLPKAEKLEIYSTKRILPKEEWRTPLFEERLTKEEIVKPSPEVEKEEKIEKGLLDFAVEGEESMKNITESTVRMTKATQEIGEIMQRRTEEANKIQQSKIPGAASRMHKLAKTTAHDMCLYAKNLEEEQPGLHHAWDTFVENTTGLIQIARISNKEDKETVIKFRNIIDGLKSANKRALDGMGEYRKSIIGLKGISQDINRACDRITSALNLIIADFVVADSYCTKVITLLDEKVEQEG